EFYANAVRTEEEKADQYPYQSYVRGIEIDFSAAKIKEILKLRRHTPDARTDYESHLEGDQKLDEVIRTLCVPTATWKLSANNRDDVKAEELIADNLAIIAESMEGRNNLIFPSTIYHLFKATGMLQAEDGQNEQHDQEDEHEEDEHDAPQFQHANPNLQGFQEEHGYNLGQLQQDLSSMQVQQTQLFENFQNQHAQYMQQYMQEVQEVKSKQNERYSQQNQFYNTIRAQQQQMSHQIQEVKESQVQYSELIHSRKLNPNLAPSPVTDIPTFMNINATQGRELFEGALWPQPVGESSDRGKGKAPLEKDTARDPNADSNDE
ncbi:hypothetical protein PIB30_100186, partial [Stylosanthes scabra]|nr:hypothetical protein [Stylosanthes scabra]